MKNDKLDRRSLGLMLSELADASVNKVLAANAMTATTARSMPAPGSPYHIGITGPPGAGKSSLVGRLAQIRTDGIRLGVLAIDPSSPKSGGAILGDRIRMDELAQIGDLYIRSFGSRSASDGLTDNIPELMAAMSHFGFDEIILETVGVGQAEYAVRPQVDTLILVLLPDSGDVVQAMKAGIMEMADIFVVNKSDLPGARKMAADVKRIASLRKQAQNSWKAPVLLTSMDDRESIAALSATIDQHREFLDQSGTRNVLLHERAKYRVRRLIERETLRMLNEFEPKFFDHSLPTQYQTVVEKLCAVIEDKESGHIKTPNQ